MPDRAIACLMLAVAVLGCMSGNHTEERPVCDSGTWDCATHAIAEGICEDEDECTVCPQESDASGKIVKWGAAAGDCRCPPLQRAR